MLAVSPMCVTVSAADQSTERKTLVVRADPRTGRLVRSVVVAPRTFPERPAALPLPSTDFGELVEQAARTHDVDPLLVHSVIKVESNYNPHAISSKGAEGLMQLTPSTARMLGVRNSFDPGQNIEAGVKYLKYLQSVYKDDRLALAAYNAGPGAVERYKQIPPYPETQNYVYQVGKRYGEARRAAAAKARMPAAVAPVSETTSALKPAEDPHPRMERFVDEHGRLHLRTLQ